MIKKLLIIIIIIAALIGLGFWSPWQKWNLSITNIIGIEEKEVYSALKVKSLAGELDIYLDGEYKDTASTDTDIIEIFPVSPGEHTLRLARRDEPTFPEVIRKLNFEAGTDVVIGYEIGPTEEFSEGHILYTRRSFIPSGDPIVEIFSTPAEIQVSIDGQESGVTPVKNAVLSLNQKHKLKFEKAGYDTLEIEIFPESQEDRDRLKNMIITLEVNLFLRPFDVVIQ